MSEQKQGKSRRRFLADMLFMGGGLSAAALLAKTQLGDSHGPKPPDIAGDVVGPIEQPPINQPPVMAGAGPAPDQTPCEPPPPPPGEPIPPETPVHSKGESKPPQPNEPKLGGKPVAPPPPPEEQP